MKLKTVIKINPARLKILAFILLAFLTGYFVRGGGKKPEVSHDHDLSETVSVIQDWTCSMHPQIRQPNPGQCPICGMDLIPVTTESSSAGTSPRELKLSPRAVKLAEIQIAPVERKFVTKEIRLVGKVAYDESRLRTITAWFPGRIDRLYADYTGIRVKKGDKLVEIYSPELLNAQEELIQARKSAIQLEQSASSTVADIVRRTVDAAREKLRLLGMSAEQIDEFEKQGKPSDRVTVFSTLDGVVVHKGAIEGMYAATGTKLYIIADLSRVWVLLDVYESDLEWIHLGQDVFFSSEAYPGEDFKGKLVFIDPVLDDKTRTVKVRIDVPNPDFRLKPNMFVRARVNAQSLHGQKGMEPPIVIPASAPLITGERAVVYVAVPGKEDTYEGREIVLGHRTGDYYRVREGLYEGEQVVVNGNFKIDSAIQILAKPSMMNPEGVVAPAGHQHQMPDTGVRTSGNMDQDADTFAVPDTFKTQLDSVYAAYFRVQYALSHDSPEKAAKESSQILEALKHVDMTLLEHDAHMAWMKELKNLQESSKAVESAQTIDAAREAFKPLSDALIRVAHELGTSGKLAVYRFHCPMAFDNKGSDWLQDKPELENPWFGSSMLKCGSLEETISVGLKKGTDSEHNH